MRDTAFKKPSDRPLLVTNEDNDHYFKLPSELMTEEGLMKFVDDLADGGHVTHIFFCPFGQRPSYASEVCEPIWEGMDDPDKEHKTHNIWCVNAKLLHDKGIDPYKVWLKRSRERGISPWLSMRMNDVHWVTEVNLAPFENMIRSCNFWREHPELRRNWMATPSFGWSGWEALAFDYSKEPVRKFHFDVFKELVDRYAPDGVELDWMRWTRHLSHGLEREQAHILTDFTRQCREYTKAASARCGHPIGLSARVPTLPEAAFELGMDPVEWAAEGLVDLIVPTNFVGAHDYTLPLEEWTKAVEKVAPDVLVLPGTSQCMRSSSSYGTIDSELEYFYSWADMMYSKGAKGLYLFNVEYLPKEKRDVLYGGGLEPHNVENSRRRFPVTFHDSTSQRDMADVQLPRPLSENTTLHLPLADVRKDSKITLVLGFGNDASEVPPLTVTLNGVGTTGVSPCGNPALFGGASVCKSAIELSLPSYAARDGMNYVRLLAVKGTTATLVWCEIIVEPRDCN